MQYTNRNNSKLNNNRNALFCSNHTIYIQFQYYPILKSHWNKCQSTKDTYDIIILKFDYCNVIVTIITHKTIFQQRETLVQHTH